MRRLLFILLALVPFGGAWADDAAVNLFEPFNENCIGPGPDFEKISESLLAQGAIRLPEQQGVEPNDPEKIFGFLLPGKPSVSFMITRSGRCAITAVSVDAEATRASLDEMLQVWKKRAEVAELPIDSRKGLLTAYRVVFPHLMMTIHLFTSTSKNGSESIILSREIYSK